MGCVSFIDSRHQKETLLSGKPATLLCLVGMPFAAGFLAISPGGRDFADFLASYILHFEAQQTSRWFVDQLGIVSARAWFKRNLPGVSIKAADKRMMGWDRINRPEFLIWTMKGKIKAFAN